MLLSGKKNLDKALNDFHKANKKFVPVLLALSTAKSFKKNASEAVNHLKEIDRQPYQPQFSDCFEKAWLQLADHYISHSNYKEAEELLSKCLDYNKSLVKAQEFMGIIKEKQGDYETAAEHYELAWTMSGKRNAGVGFRLAYNYAKGKRYVEAVVISKDVLSVYPSYSLIKTEIMDKARMNLKTS